MRKLAAGAFWVLLPLALLCLGARLLWLASRMETGPLTLEEQWWEATLGSFLPEELPITSQDPPDQAEFWLREVDRVLAAHPDDAGLCLGAALVLNNPGRGFETRYTKRVVLIPGRPELGVYVKLDEDRIARAEEEFDVRCRGRCLELAERATQLEPDNVDYWRMRALLLWHDAKPRTPDWVAVLDECARHDPDSALYDLLAANYYWGSSIEFDSNPDTPFLVVQDAQQLARGEERLEQGQQRPDYVEGNAGERALATFLGHTSVSVTDHEQIVVSREANSYRLWTLLNLIRYRGDLADEKASSGQARAAIALHRTNVPLIERLDYFAPGIAVRFLQNTTEHLNELFATRGESLAPKESAKLMALERAIRLEEKVFQEAGRPLEPPDKPTGVMLVLNYAYGVIPLMTVVLLITATILLALPCRLSRDHCVTVGPLLQMLSLLVAFSFTVVTFALAPAEIIPRDVQRWTLTVLILATPILLVGWAAWIWRHRMLRYSLRTLLIAVSVIGIGCGVVSLLRLNGHSLTNLPFDLYIPELGREQLGPLSSVGANAPPDSWPLLQWVWYYGYYVTLAVWLLLITVVFVSRAIRRRHRTDGDKPSMRALTGAYCRLIGRSCLALSGLLLLAYFVLAPTFLQRREDEFQRNMAATREPAASPHSFEQALQSVRSDNELMDRLRAEVEAEMNLESENAPDIGPSSSSQGQQ